MKKQSVRHSNRTIFSTISALLLYFGVLGTSAYGTDYTTNFPKAESIISEDGHWVTAGSPGINWHDTMCGGHGDLHVSSVSTTPGYASGPTSSERFGDALALLTGNWKPDQMAEATVRQINPSGYPEVEIRLRTSAKDATGYEIMWSALGKKGTPYIAIATWDGPGSKPPHYTILKHLKGPKYGVVTGDVVKGMIVGHTITAYTNGKLWFKITDSKFSTGNPGFGFNEGPAGTYGISSFTASDEIPQSASTDRPTRQIGGTTRPFEIARSALPTIYGTAASPVSVPANTTTSVITGTVMVVSRSRIQGRFALLPRFLLTLNHTIGSRAFSMNLCSDAELCESTILPKQGRSTDLCDRL